MAATVLNSERAVKMSVFVVRAFVRLRQMVSDDRELANKIEDLEHRLEDHDNAIQEILHAVKEMMAPEPASDRKIGFTLPAGEA